MLHKAQFQHVCTWQSICMGDEARKRMYLHSKRKFDISPIFLRMPTVVHENCIFNSQLTSGCVTSRSLRQQIEKNEPYGLCGPATCSDACVSDFITVNYFDQAPFTTGLRDPCCQASQFACIPMTCCGPPVIFSHETMCCCCISEANCKVCCLVEGVTIKTSPCNCWGCKSYICFGKPCYLEQSAALTYPLTCATFSP